ncbi:hypothetical protein D9756_009248 [Leucocoprinus leucothites]|uniref:Uncharacterized protein n=1 Tax=Leucocoprinus leucothites TaxID=201217 RepID=A0A8H5CXU3_9AGAR|nr:hypothetical protein D9756_009248 [Leucoagaricus leucothites]
MTYPTLLNPDTYLNHLPPDVATQFEITRNVYMTIFGALVWDALLYIPNDIKIITSGFGFAALCFIFSRLFAIAYALLSVLIQIHTSIIYQVDSRSSIQSSALSAPPLSSCSCSAFFSSSSVATASSSDPGRLHSRQVHYSPSQAL